MARVTHKVRYSSRSTGAGISGQTSTVKLKSSGATLDTATTDSAGIGSHDVGYPGPVTTELTYLGETKKVDSDALGFAGEYSLIDLPEHFRSFNSGVLSGVLNALALTPGTGRAVNVGTGVASILGRPLVVDAAEDVAIDANSSGLTRIDLLVARLERTFSAGVREVGRRYLTKINGTPAGSPVPPSPVQTADIWDVVLGQVTVANGAGSFVPGNIATTGRTWMVPARLDLGGTVATLDGTLPIASGGTGAGTASAARTALGLAIGTDVQAFDADLAALSTAFGAASASGPATLALHEDTDNGTNKVTLAAPAAVASDKTVTLQDVTGTVYVTGGTDVAVADGGTGASDAATARTNLGAAPTASPTFTGTVTAAAITASGATTISNATAIQHSATNALTVSETAVSTTRTVLVDTSPQRRFFLLNDTDLEMYADDAVTQVAFIEGSTGSAQFEGSLRVGGATFGATMTRLSSATAVIDPTSIAPGAVYSTNVSLPGVADGDWISCTPPGNFGSTGLVPVVRFSSAGNGTLYIVNPTAGAIDPASGTWRFVWAKFA